MSDIIENNTSKDSLINDFRIQEERYNNQYAGVKGMGTVESFFKDKETSINEVMDCHFKNQGITGLTIDQILDKNNTEREKNTESISLSKELVLKGTERLEKMLEERNILKNKLDSKLKSSGKNKSSQLKRIKEQQQLVNKCSEELALLNTTLETLLKEGNEIITELLSNVGVENKNTKEIINEINSLLEINQNKIAELENSIIEKENLFNVLDTNLLQEQQNLLKPENVEEKTNKIKELFKKTSGKSSEILKNGGYDFNLFTTPLNSEQSIGTKRKGESPGLNKHLKKNDQNNPENKRKGPNRGI